MTLAGLEPVFVYPAFDRDLGIYTGVTAQMVKRALDRDPDIVGAVITSPTYYGICSDIWGIAMCLHNSGKFLIVDEAHGAHFAFHEALPGTALEQGADLCIQSAHKTLPAMGQCSLLHVGRNAAVEPEEIRRTLRILQTTSPSYLLMASLDEAVLDMERARTPVSGPADPGGHRTEGRCPRAGCAGFCGRRQAGQAPGSPAACG